jgi:hypothetical protein
MNLKKTAILVALLFGGSLFASAEQINLVVNLISGEKTVISVDSSLHAGFTDTDMLFKSNTVDISIPRADIKNFNFDNGAGISDTSTEFDVSFSADAIHFANLPQNSSIQVFSAAGITLLSDTASGEYLIQTSNLPKGVNLVKVNNLTYKVNIK